uniref:Uncharacterized protein n=1 Tax=viral metagenome TaxID=1070528 RepID=A0A6C0HLA3_9ZZZZ
MENQPTTPFAQFCKYVSTTDAEFQCSNDVEPVEIFAKIEKLRKDYFAKSDAVKDIFNKTPTMKMEGFHFSIRFDPNTGKSVAKILTPPNPLFTVPKEVANNTDVNIAFDPCTFKTQIELVFGENNFCDALEMLTKGDVKSFVDKPVFSFRVMNKFLCDFIKDVLLPDHIATTR